MTALRYNNQGGTLGAGLTNNGTTITFTLAPNFATLTGGQTITLVLDAGTGNMEIVYLTAYTATATTGTITRAAEDSAHWPAVTHASGTGTWIASATINDFNSPTFGSALTVPNGGTGATTLTGLVKGNGASAMTAVAAPTGTVVGTSDSQVLTNKDLSGAGNVFPTLNQNTTGTAADLSATLIVGHGGTGATSLTGLVVGNGTSAMSTVAAPGGAVVGINDTQILTNKDLTSGTNTFPTFNQNTTGSAAKWTTARNLAGNAVDGHVDVAFANKFIVQGTGDAGLSGAQFTGGLASGIVKNATTTGILSIAAAGTDYVAPGGALGTPSSGTLTNATGLPESGVVNLVSDLALKAALASPTFTGTVTIPNGAALGTPATLTLTNATGLPESGVTNLTSDLSTLTTAVATKLTGPLTGDVTTSSSAATLVDTANVEQLIRLQSLDQMTPPAADLNMNSRRIYSGAVPQWPTDFALLSNVLSPTVVTVNAPGATPTINVGAQPPTMFANFTGVATAITNMSTNLKGTPVTGQLLTVGFTDNATSQTISWGASFVAGDGIELPGATIPSTLCLAQFLYNGTNWQITRSWPGIITSTSNSPTIPVNALVYDWTPTGTATPTIATTGAFNGQKMIVRIYAAFTISSWTNCQSSINVTLPANSTGATSTKPLTVAFIYVGAATAWQCAGVA